MRKIKNEVMTHWDGLLTKSGYGIRVLAATDRPFDLDEAIIRKFECRIMVGLPSVKSREIILRKLLSKGKIEGLDFKELAAMTEGCCGSDLKEKKRKAEEGDSLAESWKTGKSVDEEPRNGRLGQVAAGFACEGSVMRELKTWNDLYGEGGLRKKQRLSYFLSSMYDRRKMRFRPCHSIHFHPISFFGKASEAEGAKQAET
ncbi:putative suppressor protein of bem1/bed5 double mutants [Cocos nucifera]|uniref:Putative suppressor protein of bem1/bed5 double mutants n=1 Tax=Cocos nucifera TaxID=13894 RepID=A0A8K0IAL7_COCNU|nr:putative suppressor protein of bem1/bed5 double mutants [Cocos nucifera]